MYSFVFKNFIEDFLEPEFKKFKSMEERDGFKNNVVNIAVLRELEKIMKVAKLYYEGSQIQEIEEAQKNEDN